MWIIGTLSCSFTRLRPQIALSVYHVDLSICFSLRYTNYIYTNLILFQILICFPGHPPSSVSSAPKWSANESVWRILSPPHRGSSQVPVAKPKLGAKRSQKRNIKTDIQRLTTAVRRSPKFLSADAVRDAVRDYLYQRLNYPAFPLAVGFRTRAPRTNTATAGRRQARTCPPPVCSASGHIYTQIYTKRYVK